MQPYNHDTTHTVNLIKIIPYTINIITGTTFRYYITFFCYHILRKLVPIKQSGLIFYF